MLDKHISMNSEKAGIWAAASFAACIMLLVVPMFFSSFRFPSWPAAVEFGVATILIAVFLTALNQTARHRRWLNPLFWLMLALVFLVRLTWFLVLDFSGEGFTDNFYVHISTQALDVALREYSRTLALALLAFTVAATIMVYARKKAPARPASAYTAAAASLLLYVLIPFNGPEGQILANYVRFQQSMDPGQLDERGVSELAETGLVSLEGNRKTGIIASTGPNPKNLVLVYLESFHLAFTDDGPIPDLTPNINRLKREFGHHANWLSSADATMEGMISTLCGTLVSTPQGSSTFANTDSILPHLACLPDVLHAAGYHQVFLGGFDKNFSGKNLFLTGHGYDEVIGWEEWQQRGLRNNDGYWGLPDDELFRQAVEWVKGLEADSNRQPYNLTLLTLSTHPPGFAASSCTPYQTGPEKSILLEAIHCTDQVVGEFVRQLRAGRLLENTTLVITGDHDIFNLPEVREYFPGVPTDPRLLSIIIDPERSFSYAEQLNVAYDLAPTLLDFLGVEHNVGFIWGDSVFEPRSYHVSRRFRGANFDELEFQDLTELDCRDSVNPPSPPLDGCEHKRILGLSDRYLYGFYQKSEVYAGLCDKENELLAEVQMGAEPVSIRFHGNELAKSFAYEGRPLNPATAGFYLFIKASQSRAAQFYYYGLDHVYWQMQLVITLLELAPEDQFVLLYKPENAPAMIEPLERLLTNYGLNQPGLGQPFIIASNGSPGKEEVFFDRGESAARLRLASTHCAALTRAGDRPVVERNVINELLRPYREEFPGL
jgi:phosphoglycerol transferase MdoB-like AlkP superfamily enzyme